MRLSVLLSRLTGNRDDTTWNVDEVLVVLDAEAKKAEKRR